MINGIQLPTGVFIPALVVGATWGRIFGLILLKIFPQMVRTHWRVALLWQTRSFFLNFTPKILREVIWLC